MRSWRKLLRSIYLIVLCLIASFFVVGYWRSDLHAPSPSHYFVDRQNRYLGEWTPDSEGKSGYWRLETVPKRVAAASLTLEDRHFYKHCGVDPISIGRAFFQNMHHGRRVSGASTIAMQISRMQNPGDRTYLNKLLEMATAVFLTMRHGQEELLKHYLSVVPYGNQIHGIELAARKYFDKPVDDLSWAEVALLAALPQAPAKMNPYRFDTRQRAISRGRRILDRLKDEGMLSSADFELANKQIGHLTICRRPERPDAALHFLMRLTSQDKNDKDHLSIAQDPGKHFWKTTLDLELQNASTDIVLDAVVDWENRGVGNAAAIILDREDCSVITYIGSSGYFDKKRCGSIDFAGISRSSGSTLKPFIFALGLDQGIIDSNTILDDLLRGPGGITNSDESFFGPMLPRFALANSRNVPAIHLLSKIGIDRTFDFFRSLGLHNTSLPARYFGLGLAIGGLSVTLENLVKAYTLLACDGELQQIKWRHDAPTQKGKRLLSSSTARLITHFLADPMARLPTFKRMSSTEYRFETAVKTGTSSNYRDEWTIAYSKNYITAVWVGHPKGGSMQSGQRFAASLCQRLLNNVYEHYGLWPNASRFMDPANYRMVEICTLTGKKASMHCPNVVSEWLKISDEPLETCTAHRVCIVDSRTGDPIEADTPRKYIQTRHFADLGVKYAIWNASQSGTRSRQMAKRPLIPEMPSISGPPKIKILTPESGMKIIKDPETPASLSSIALNVSVEPIVSEVVWEVDGYPFKAAAFPYTVRWLISEGEHVFTVSAPSLGVRSNPVKILVQ